MMLIAEREQGALGVCGSQLTPVTIAIEIYRDLTSDGGVKEQEDVSPSNHVSIVIVLLE